MNATSPAAIRQVLENTPGIVAAYLFGSAAEGRDHRESDVDVGVLLDRSLYPESGDRFDVRLRLIGRLRAAVGREVDLAILNDVPPPLGRHVMTRGQPVLILNPELNHAHLRLTLSRAADLEPFLRRTRAVKLQALSK